MSDIIRMEIAIPADNDGFVLLQCPLCGEFFKLKPDDIKADDVIEIWCPCCGLKSDSYVTVDIIELAERVTKNLANNMIFEQMKELEHQIKGNGISFKAGEKPREELEAPIIAGIEALEIVNYKCCKREAKVKPLVKMCGGYCPYCGVGYDEN